MLAGRAWTRRERALLPGRASVGSVWGIARKPRNAMKRRNVPYGNGWFVASTPLDGRLLAATQMRQPENNAITIKTMQKALAKHPHDNALILYRMCQVFREASKEPGFDEINYWSCDLWHGLKHNNKCPCNPHVHIRLKRRLKNINTSVAEQVFSWMRGFARTFNELRPERHRFLMLLYCKRHNHLIETKQTYHLNKYSFHTFNRRGKVKAHHCSAKVNTHVLKK